MSNYAPYLRHLANGSMQLSQLGLEEIADSFEALEARVKELEIKYAQEVIDHCDTTSRMHKAESELARLKAQKAVAFIAISKGGFDKGTKIIDYYLEDIEQLEEGSKLYAEPRPAVLPERKMDSALAYAESQLTPRLMRNHIHCFERYGTPAGDATTALQAQRIALSYIEWADDIRKAAGGEIVE